MWIPFHFKTWAYMASMPNNWPCSFWIQPFNYLCLQRFKNQGGQWRGWSRKRYSSTSVLHSWPPTITVAPPSRWMESQRKLRVGLTDICSTVQIPKTRYWHHQRHICFKEIFSHICLRMCHFSSTMQTHYNFYLVREIHFFILCYFLQLSPNLFFYCCIFFGWSSGFKSDSACIVTYFSELKR